MKIEYKFEGRTFEFDALYHLTVEHLDILSGLVISYRLLSQDRVTKAAKAQDAFIQGYLYGLEMANMIDSQLSNELYQFFMES